MAIKIKLKTEASIDPPIQDTSGWTILLEDGFDDGLSDNWQQQSGEWSVVDGAACGTLQQPDGGFEGYARLERELSTLPSIFEIEYEVKTSVVTGDRHQRKIPKCNIFTCVPNRERGRHPVLAMCL